MTGQPDDSVDVIVLARMLRRPICREPFAPGIWAPYHDTSPQLLVDVHCEAVIWAAGARLDGDMAHQVRGDYWCGHA